GVTSSLFAAPAAGLVGQPGSSVAGVTSSLGAAAAQLAGSRSIGLVGSEGAERSGSAAFNASAALSAAMTSAAGASSHPGAEPQQRSTRLADLQLQVQSVSGTGSAGGTLASLANTASAAVLPAHWVLTGGGLAPAGVGRAAAVTPFGSDAETVEGVDVPDGVGSEGSGPVTDAGARTHVGARQSQAAADPIDLTGDARNAINGGDSESGSEELARKLAEGIAQRVLAAVASNNWKLQIDLKPAHLGHVSIEMTMRQGQLDAVFDASQASSRALISEGLDRLRQDLQRAGMNVAHLGLNFGSGARSGGNSTPRGREDGQSEVVGGAIDEVASVALSQRPQAAPGDGLDVLV
ncbi:MAG: flagellar hook-length control protein FliK, partial [Betaproteobacteria bacterium]